MSQWFQAGLGQTIVVLLVTQGKKQQMSHPYHRPFVDESRSEAGRDCQTATEFEGSLNHFNVLLSLTRVQILKMLMFLISMSQHVFATDYFVYPSVRYDSEL